ncbi:MAG TPA: hypothetical protein VLL57_01570, partial [Candidatus Binataceae bacterium]|nr:hypothetical protein [Candidatus Binataceae bacterium]
VSQASLEEVRAIIEASLYPSIAFFYVGGISAPKTALSVADLEYVVQNLVGVAVGAFDECSFLMWWRRTSVPFPARTEPIA